MTDDEIRGYLGISGSRNGCTQDQYEQVKNFLRVAIQKAYHTLNTGCCLGVDELVSVYAHYTCDMRIVAFPPIKENYLSRITLDLADETHEPDDYLVRNRNIVHNSELMLFVRSFWYLVHNEICTEIWTKNKGILANR